MILLSKRVQEISASPTLAISAKAKAMKKSGIDVVGFGAGEPDFDTPMHIKFAGIKAIKEGFTKYTPASGTLELKSAILEKFKRDNGLVYDTSQIIVGCGAKHILYNIFQAVCSKGDEVIIFSPYWVSYPEMLKLAGGVPVVIETAEDDEFKPPIEKIKNSITNKTRAIIINSPNNPTGAVYSEELLRKIASIIIEKNIIAVSDEVYEKMIYKDNRHVSIASFDEEIKKRTIVVNAVSKSYSMTGWRIGYAAGPFEIISAMAKIQSHSTSNPASISQMAAIEALCGDQGPSGKMMEKFSQRRDYVIKRCEKLNGTSFFAPQGGFYIFLNISGAYGRKPGIDNSVQFAESLLNEAHVAVVPGSAFGAGRYIRITFANSLEEIAKGFDRIEEFLKK